MGSHSFNRRQLLKASLAGAACLNSDVLWAQGDEIPPDLLEQGVTAKFLEQMGPTIDQSPYTCHDVVPQTSADLLKSLRFAIDVNGLSIPTGDDGKGLTLKSIGVNEEDAQKPPPRQAQGIAKKAKRWPAGRVTWGMVGPQTSENGRILEHCKSALGQWAELTCLEFQQIKSTPSEADIRISCIPGRGHYSLVGTDSRMARDNRQFFAGAISQWNESLNITPSSSTSDTEYLRVALHELGHALGLLHEQFHLTNPIAWDRRQVYAFFWRKHKWTIRDTDINVFNNPNIVEVEMTATRDRDSIMHYWFPQYLHGNGDSVPHQPNNVLSDRDKKFMRAFYQCPEGDIADKPVDQPSAPKDKPTEAVQIVEVGKPLESSIRTTGDVRSFEIRIVSGDKYAIETIDYPSTPVRVKLYETKALKRVLQVASFNGKHLLNAKLSTKLEAGSHYVTVEHVNRTESSIGEFTLSVKRD